MRVSFLSRRCCQWLFVMVMSFIVGAAPTFGAETKSPAVSGQARFESQCARCHGASGKGNGLQAMALFLFFKVPDLTDPAFMRTRSNEDLFRSIKQGYKGMPSFGLKLSESEIKDLVVYVRSFVKTQ